MRSTMPRAPLAVLAFALASTGGGLPAAPPEATFTPLSGLGASADMMFAYRMCDGGDAVVGEAPPTDGVHGEGVVALRTPDATWTVTSLGVFATSGAHYSPAFGIAHAGHRIVGLASSGSPPLDVPYAWTSPGPPAALPLLAGDLLGDARAVSANGRTIVGWGRTERTDRFRESDPFSHALRWNVIGDPPTLIDSLAGSPIESQAMAATVNGFVIAGFAVSDRSKAYPFDPTTESRGHEAIVWQRDGAGVYRRRWLGFLPGSTPPSRAYAISQDGERIAGFSGPFGASRPVVWTRQRHPLRYVIRDLGVLAGYQAGGASAVSADGRVVVGSCYRIVGEAFESEAFIWDEVHGTRDLRDALLAAGADEVDGWNLVDATGVSRDGTWISGHGTSPDGSFTAWVASLP